MAARYRLGSVSNSREFSKLQNKVDNLYDSYNHNSNTTNYIKCCDIIEQNADVQRKLYDSLGDISTEGLISSPISSRPLHRSCYLWPYYDYYYYYPYYYYPYTSAAAAAAALAASTAISNDLALYKTVSRKNAEIADLSYKYEKDLSELEHKLNHVELDNSGLKAELDVTKDKLLSEKFRSTSVETAAKADIAELKTKLHLAESKLASLEPQAELANELEREIFDLKHEIRHYRTTNAILAEHNEIQSHIIRSRPVSPCIFRSRSSSPFLRPRSLSPCLRRSSCLRTSRPVSPVCSASIRAVSPLSPTHCTQVIRQESLISRFNDLHSRDRLNAMDNLRSYCDDYENNQRIIFAAVQEAFSAAKRAFTDWKIRVRSNVALTHSGPETLEEAVQNYINRNVDLYLDLPSLTSEVISALNRNPKISLPAGVCYSVISSFIREASRIAWEMSALAYPLDTAFALDGEVIDESRYRRTYDSEYTAPLIDHHVWPCLMQACKVIAKGEACTRRGASLRGRSASPYHKCCSRSRSSSPLRNRY